MTARHESKMKLLDAAVNVVRAKGYTATRIEDVCAAAGLTKGSFFHHFKGKDDLALEAAEHWRESGNALFSSAPYHALPDPVDRLLGYIDFRKEILTSDLPGSTCFAGTIIQEVYETNPTVRDANAKALVDHAASLEPDISEAISVYGLSPDWTANSLAIHFQAVVQGAFIMAKAKGEADEAIACLDHLRRYVVMLFGPRHEGKSQRTGGRGRTSTREGQPHGR